MVSADAPALDYSATGSAVAVASGLRHPAYGETGEKATMATAVPGTILGSVMPGAAAGGAYLNKIPDGQMTTTVYTFIRQERYQDAVVVLSNQLQNFPRSRKIF